MPFLGGESNHPHISISVKNHYQIRDGTHTTAHGYMAGEPWDLGGKFSQVVKGSEGMASFSKRKNMIRT
jgi:hypothetical protein